MSDIDHLFEQNKQWAQKITSDQPEFFDQLSKQQTPEYLWIGCSDSRVPANQLLGLPPGEIFVHRNIANVVVHTDLNCLSVIQYAVEVLKVKHIFVCGHYGCGGVAASMTDAQHGLIDNWLRHIKDVQRFNKDELERLSDQERFNRLCELNVIEQVKNVANTTMVQNAWNDDQPVTVHGFIYDIQNGILKNLEVSVSGNE
ncbi:carbonate dehydratase [Thalassotalea litorea]|uniref:Carbonic anhydrase n=1 Tax=Thalassotalea litorea TaxID=2020715 RepID=A0A5R9II87_9GAMM|nr:carbonate dehydratase [Thalassotalea litorea]TLU64173.1 carbonate dehydratase [Thalassotalea litorea]